MANHNNVVFNLIAVVIGSFICSILVYIFCERANFIIQNENRDQFAKTLSSTLALACNDIITRGAYDELNNYTDIIIAEYQEIEEIAIFDIEGLHLGHKLRNEKENKIGKNCDNEFMAILENINKPIKITTKDKKTLYIAPVYVGHSRLGYVVLNFKVKNKMLWEHLLKF